MADGGMDAPEKHETLLTAFITVKKMRKKAEI